MPNETQPPKPRAPKPRGIGTWPALVRAAGHLVRAACAFVGTMIRLIASWLSVPLITVAEIFGRVARAAEKRAAEIEKKIEERESRLD